MKRFVALAAGLVLMAAACDIDTSGPARGSAGGFRGGTKRATAGQHRMEARRDRLRQQRRLARIERRREARLAALRRERRRQQRREETAAAAAPAAAAPAPQPESCTDGYDPCLPPAADYDCEGGTGDGPSYTGYVSVTGYDPYDLDADGDGVGCES